MTTELDEPVSVAAVFSHGTVKPVWFSRKNRRTNIREIAFTWKSRAGGAVILHFSVAGEGGLFELCFDTSAMNWRLMHAQHSAH